MAKKRVMYLLSDIHFMSDRPICRSDVSKDFIETQVGKLEFISKLASDDDAPILISGDIFDKARSANILSKYFMQTFKNNYLITIPGQHDLPYHSLSKLDDSSLGVVEEGIRKMKVIKDPSDPVMYKGIYIFGIPFGQSLIEAKDLMYSKNKRIIKDSSEIKILMLHTLVSQQDDPEIKMLGSTDLRTVIRMFDSFNVILVGDNHKTFTKRFGTGDGPTHILVNPGSVIRKTAAQMDHTPVVFKYFVDDDLVKRIQIPIDKNVISREHIDSTEAIDSRSRAFIEKLSSGNFGLSFKENVKKAIRVGKPPKEVISIINEAIEQ